MMPWEKQRDWNRLEVTSQNEAAKQSLKVCCRMLGLQEDAELVEVQDNNRFILSYKQDPDKPEFTRAMLRLETLMRQTLGVFVDLRLEPMEDKMKRKKRNVLLG